MVPVDRDIITTERDLATVTGFEVFGVNSSGTYRGEIQALEQYLDTHDPNVLLQITRPPTHGTIAGVLARRHDVPFVYRYSGDRFYEYRVARGSDRLKAFGLGATLGRLPIRLATRHITLGPTGKRRLIARGVSPDRITILPPTVDPTRFDDPDPVSLDVPRDRTVVLFVGRLSHLKGVDTLERIIPEVLNQRDDLQFVCVGDAERELDLPQHARDHVSIIGRVPPDAVPNYMATADLLVHPSLTEGVPRVLLEALAVGTPVLARDVGDVASVTDNTFRTDTQLVVKLMHLEALPLDDVAPFTREHLAPAYQRFFEHW
ncbi:glycosyltransferase family 4 protein [Natrinema zhouii]|uniref:Glycosyltransferase family 4 protein n=1 Tax=Natrinema zhouii TaxID=1710539 RepID=A0A7D6CQQ8_9EURY|nr:glycosyltransferase family 4 protein [Natrinema zhouii]QLK26816.1 glycosyltransferase family 4 protein [Natrinema zhouii]